MLTDTEFAVYRSWGEITPEVREYADAYEKVRDAAREKLAEIKKRLDEHSAEMLTEGVINYGYVGDIVGVDNLLADVLVCLTGEGE